MNTFCHLTTSETNPYKYLNHASHHTSCRSLPVRALKIMSIKAICTARLASLHQGWREARGKLLEVKVRGAHR